MVCSRGLREPGISGDMAQQIRCTLSIFPSALISHSTAQVRSVGVESGTTFRPVLFDRGSRPAVFLFDSRSRVLDTPIRRI